MRRILTITLFTLLSCSVFAKQHPTVKITDLAIKESANNVAVSFDAFVSGLGSNYKLILSPVLYNDSTGENHLLTPIVFIGKKKATSLKREKKGLSESIRGRTKQKTPYRVSIPYESWMDKVSLKVNFSIEGCCMEEPLAPLNLVSGKLIRYDLVPVFNASEIKPPLTALEQYDIAAPFLYSANDYALRYEIFEKQREKGALIVYFEQGYSSIDRAFKDNQNTLKQVNNALDMINADPNASLKKIVIVGLASPEGSLAKNDILAEKRANALKYFVGERVKYDPDLFEIINGSEDWDGLKKLVEASRMPGRWQVLEIIENYSIRGGREVELMKLHGGDPYRYMLKHFFPQLRNAGYVQIYYDKKTDPEVERINRAITLIDEQRYEEALSLLYEVSDKKRVANAIGVCYMMTGNYTKAEEYFARAIANGNQDAVENLNRIKIAQSIKKN